MAGASVAAALRSSVSTTSPSRLALALCALGTLDDRSACRSAFGCAPGRCRDRALDASASAGMFPSDALNLALTILWVVGVVNAFNLMDNLDGAAGTVARVCADRDRRALALMHGEP